MATNIYAQRSRWASLKSRFKLLLIAILAITVAVQGLLPFLEAGKRKLGWGGTFDPDWKLDITGVNGAVASDTALCSQMGVDVLKNGGSAADAAVQVCLCIGTMEPQSSGIGGGGFITVRFPNGSSIVIDARETAPAAAHKHMYDKDPSKSKIFGLASGVPGELAGLQKLWEVGGTLPWVDLVEPVADLNDAGFARSDALKNAADAYKQQLYLRDPATFSKILETSDWCWMFSDEPKCTERHDDRGTANWIKRPQLARTLRQIAREGVGAFYNGSIADSIVRISDATGGILTREDLANYSVVVRPALISTFLNRTVITASEPASGPAFLMGLHAIEKLLKLDDKEKHEPFTATPKSLDRDPVMRQRIVEVMKWMAAARSELGDPAYINNPKIPEIVEPEWANNVAGNVSDSKTLPSWRDYHPSFEMNNPAGTTHFSIVDKSGMAVSMTTTVNLPFGNGVCDPITGIVMNSEMDDFSIPYQRNSFELAPSIYNFVAPGKRPLSSTVPTVIISPDGETVEMVIGAAGGSRILTAVFLATTRVLGLHLEPLEAVSFPRYHHQLIPERLSVERGYTEQEHSDWSSRGHKVETMPPASTMNLIFRDKAGTLHAISDYYRKRGMGAAY